MLCTGEYVWYGMHEAREGILCTHACFKRWKRDPVPFDSLCPSLLITLRLLHLYFTYPQKYFKLLYTCLSKLYFSKRNIECMWLVCCYMRKQPRDKPSLVFFIKRSSRRKDNLKRLMGKSCRCVSDVGAVASQVKGVTSFMLKALFKLLLLVKIFVLLFKAVMLLFRAVMLVTGLPLCYTGLSCYCTCLSCCYTGLSCYSTWLLRYCTRLSCCYTGLWYCTGLSLYRPSYILL